MGVIELLVIGTIAGMITAATGAKAVFDSASNLVHARKGTKPTANEPRGFGKYWRQVWEDEAAKHAIKERKRRQRLKDDDHVTVGDWWAKMRSEARRKAMAKRGLKTDADIARAQRRHRERMEREGLAVPTVPAATSPDAPQAPDLATTEVDEPEDRSGKEGQEPYSPFRPPPGEEPAGTPDDGDLRAPRNSGDGDVYDLVDRLTEQLQATEKRLSEANLELTRTRTAYADAQRSGSTKAEEIAELRARAGHAEKVARQVDAERTRIAQELALAQEQLGLIGKAWTARQPDPEPTDEPERAEGFDGVVIDGEVIDPNHPTSGAASAAPEPSKSITNGMEHHMSNVSGEITTLEATGPYVEAMTEQAGGSISLLDTAAGQLNELTQLSDTLDAAMVNMESAIANLRASKVDELFITELEAARERYAVAKANIDTATATAANLARAGEQLAAARAAFEGLEQEVAGHINAADHTRNSTVGDLAYMGIDRG